jgi:hypothetical protein
MGEDVRLEVADEQQRQRARVGFPDDLRVHGSLEVGGEDAQAAARQGVVGGGVERDDEGGLARAHVHLHGDGGADDVLHEGDELFGEAAEDDPRVFRAFDCGELDDRLGQHEVPRAHGRSEEGLLRFEVPQDRRRRDLQTAGDVRQGGRVEAALGEGAPGGVEDLFAGDARWPAH